MKELDLLMATADAAARRAAQAVLAGDLDAAAWYARRYAQYRDAAQACLARVACVE